MATIKLQPSGKVVLKDGKVACACCAQPSECCMYPAQALVDGLYTADDLPDFINLAGNLLIKQSTGFPRYAYPDSGQFYVNDPEEEGDLWSVVIFGSTNFNLDCLISSFNGSAPLGIEDLFADSYTITYDSDITCQSVSSTVTRESVCTWKGIADDGTTITLEIEFGSFNDVYAWTTNAPNCGGNRRGIGMPFDRDNNLGRLKTPLGNYEDEITQGSVIHIVS